jgi:hypothetical protein
MNSNMFELSKVILQRVSFDRHLFSKELKKAIRWIKREDLHAFKAWCQAHFGNKYPDVIEETFNKETVS